MKVRKMLVVLLFISLLCGQYPVGKAVSIEEDMPFEKIQNNKVAERLIKKQKRAFNFYRQKK